MEPFDITVQNYPRNDAPKELLIAAESYERRFEITFQSFTVFPEGLLHELHRAHGDPDAVPDSVTVASHSDATIVEDIEVLYGVANASSIDRPQREQYFAALKRVYRKLPSSPGVFCLQSDALCVGIERDGRILAESMAWLPPEHSVHPDMKRIPYQGGLAVGVVNPPSPGGCVRCAVVDGAIASGATIITLIEYLRSTISDFFIYSVHSSTEGVRAIARYSQAVGVGATITVGHVTTGINKKFYAIDPDDETKVVVGDLGDTISELSTSKNST